MELELNKIDIVTFRGLGNEEREVVGFMRLLKDEHTKITDTALKEEFEFFDIPTILNSLQGKNILIKK